MRIPDPDRLVIGPTNATSAVIWLHGLGANGHDFEPIVPHLNCPHVQFVFPHAPMAPVTINGGFVMPSWYDILTMDRVANRENESDIRRSAERISALIAELNRAGIPASRIVLAGFSQGGAVALHVGLRHPETLAGLMALSTYVVLTDSVATEAHKANAATPLLWCHGSLDGVVPISLGRTGYDLIATGRPSEFKTSRMQHELNGPEIVGIREWLLATLPA